MYEIDYKQNTDKKYRFLKINWLNDLKWPLCKKNYMITILILTMNPFLNNWGPLSSVICWVLVHLWKQIELYPFWTKWYYSHKQSILRLRNTDWITHSYNYYLIRMCLILKSFCVKYFLFIFFTKCTAFLKPNFLIKIS